MSTTTSQDLTATLAELQADLDSISGQTTGTVRKTTSKTEELEPLPADGYLDPTWGPLFDTWMHLKRPVILKGPASTWKTTQAKRYAAKHGLNLYVQQGYRDILVEEVRGSRDVINEKGTSVTRYTDAQLVRSLRDPLGIYLFDEVNTVPEGFLAILNILLDGHKEMTIPETGETLKVHDNWRFIGTCNPGYLGTLELPEALISRCCVIECEPQPQEYERRVLVGLTNIPIPEATAIVTIAQAVRKANEGGEIEFDMCLRTMTAMADLWMYLPPEARSIRQTFIDVVLPKVGFNPNDEDVRGARRGLLDTVDTLLAST